VNQLYLWGSVISENTIGGYDSGICGDGSSCSLAQAEAEDFNRMSVFENKKPYAVYAPNNNRITIKAITKLELAIATAPGFGNYPARCIKPEEMTNEVRGEGSNTRSICNILPEQDKADSLLVVEVKTPAGNWSSYPPHKHDSDNIPVVGMLFLIAFYVGLWWREASRNDKRIANGEFKTMKEETQDRIHVWPYLTRVEFLAAIIVMIILTVWSIVLNAPLEEPANPTRTPNPSKAPWYFLGLQEMLVYFDPWIAGVVLPTLIIIGLMVIPYIDPNKKGNGYYTFKERPFAISVFLFGFIVLWLSLIILGTFLRGPGWNFFAPWELWDVHKVVAMTNVDLHEVVGIRSKWGAGIFGFIVVGGYFTLIPLLWLWKRKSWSIFKTLGPLRYSVTAFLFLSMMGLVIKMILRIAFNIKYVWVTPWFNV